MKEREQEVDSYWQIDLAVGEGQIHGEQHAIRLRVHTSTEPYRDGEGLAKLAYRHGERTYFHARPYILVPEVTLTIGVYEKPTARDQIGEVIGSEWQGDEASGDRQCSSLVLPLRPAAYLVGVLPV